jgi:hypothetical protein
MVVLVCGFNPLWIHGDEVMEFSKSNQKVLFDRYKIPESLHQYEDVALHLYWMSWYVEVTSKDNWQEATRHPVLYKEGRDLSNVQMSYYFGTTKKNDRQTDFCLRQFVYDYVTRDNKTKLDSLLFGYINISSDGVPSGFWSDFHDLRFYHDKDEIDFDNSIWKKGKFAPSEEFPSEEAFHKDHLSWLKEIPIDDIRLSILNKKPIPPITLETENDYTLQIPQHIHPDARKVILRVIKKYKVLKSGQVKKLLEDIHLDLNEYDNGAIFFRFEKKHLFDAAIDARGYPVTRGSYFMFDDKSRVKMWLEGDMRELEDSFSKKRADPKKTKYTIDGDGVEIHFHPTGFPKSYRTIVRNRLFGRQIEWDENGKIISNVDLEFPQQWKEAPEKIKK